MASKLHWRASGYSVPRARCGAWIGTAKLTSKEDEVTCRKCRNFLLQARLDLDAVRGRTVTIDCHDGTSEQGTLIDAGPTGLELGRDSTAKARTIRWSRIKGFTYHERTRAAEEPEEPEDAAGAA